jgi:hypothetical protein
MERTKTYTVPQYYRYDKYNNPYAYVKPIKLNTDIKVENYFESQGRKK